MNMVKVFRSTKFEVLVTRKGKETSALRDGRCPFYSSLVKRGSYFTSHDSQ